MADMVVGIRRISRPFSSVRLSSQVLPDALEEGMPHLSLSGFRAIFDFGQQFRLNPNAAVRDLFGVGISGVRRACKAVVDLASIDQVPALAPADIDAVEFLAVERKTGDRQRLALGAGFLGPIVGAAGTISAVAQLRDDTFEAGLAGVLVHLASIDFEALTELDIRIGDVFLRTAFRSCSGNPRRSRPLR